MFPSLEDKRMRTDGVALINVPSLPTEQLTFDSVCAFIIDRLRHDFISGKDTITAYCVINQPWTLPDFPDKVQYNNTALYGGLLEKALFEAFDDHTSVHHIASDDPIVTIFFRKVIIKSYPNSTYAVSIMGSIVEHAILAA